MDASVAKVWGPKLAKEKINVKKALKLDGSLGVFAAGHARQLYACFSTYIKEESSSILKAMTITLQVASCSFFSFRGHQLLVIHDNL